MKDQSQTLKVVHEADSHNVISVQGARENNLKSVHLELPKRRITVFTGVSGSGKSSLVFGTIGAESQRLMNETYSAFLQGFMPSPARPDVDLLEGLTTTILVEQERMGTNARSTVGTATDINALLRIVFSRIGTPSIGSPQAFSFNVASFQASGAIKVDKGKENTKPVHKTYSRTGGMCVRCEGMGNITDIDFGELFDENKSLVEGALTIPGYTVDGWAVRIFTESGFIDPKKPIAKYTKKERQAFLYAEPVKVKIAGINMTYEGLVPKIQKSFLSKDPESMQPHIRAFVDRAVTYTTCPECEGTRLNELARSSRIDALSIADVCKMEMHDVLDWVRRLQDSTIQPLRDALVKMIESFVEIGLGYLSLDRSTSTLSGGESQRTKMVRHLGSSLTDVTYVFDEPTIGLHPHDIERMNTLLLRLRDKGNTVFVVEHKPEVMRIADHIVDLGPGAGSAGGEIAFEGSFEDLALSDTKTGRHLFDRIQTKQQVRKPKGFFEVRQAAKNNLKHVNIDIPLGVLVTVTGVAGSGKSSLIEGCVVPDERVVFVDQSAIKGSRRSNPATYTGILEPIRKAFAKANGVKPALFSSNSEGACPVCSGAGVVYPDLGVVAGSAPPCQECQGKRFQASVLEYTFGEKNISDIFAMSIFEAKEFFSQKGNHIRGVGEMLGALVKSGIGYVSLGQPLTSLSGGERQRLKLALQMKEEAEIYVLDEPTTGLHLANVGQLLSTLDGLVDSGKSVIVVEHHQAVMACSDWIIDMGPGAGYQGGSVVFQGTPQQLAQERKTVTGEHLAQYLGIEPAVYFG